MNCRWRSLLTLALVFVFSPILHAQVPSLINYQGRIVVGTTNFDGSGLFRFSLVNSNGSATFWSNDGTGSGGSQPAAAVTLTVTRGLYSVQLGDTNLANMTAVPSTVFTNSDVRLRVWFNNGVSGSQLLSPDQRIAAVGYAMMAATVPDGSITGAKLASGSITSGQLAPGAALTNLQASGLAGVGSSGIILSPLANATNLLNAGYVRIPSMKIESVTERWKQRLSFPFANPFSPVARTGNTALWDGTEMIVWGGIPNSDDIGGDLNTGGRYNPATDSWLPTAVTNGMPAAGSGHTAVWTGTEMMVWGGSLGIQGWRYNPSTDSWTAMNTNNAPPARSGHIAYYVSPQNTMVIWFGSYFDTNLSQTVYLNDGWCYSNNTWTAVSPPNTPSARTAPLSIWDGARIIVFGGTGLDTNGNVVVLNSSARITGTNLNAGWTTAGLPWPGPRLGATAVTLGTNMVIWGGYTNDPVSGAPVYLNDGARYFPGAPAPAWTNLSASPLSSRANQMAVSMGGKMIVWGGVNTNGECFDGAIYNNTNNTWVAISTNKAPSARDSGSAVWDGTEMIVWGGFDGANHVNTGGRYLPSSDSWQNVLATFSATGRANHTAVWTGAEMIVWGGFDGEYYFNTGARYNPVLDTWTAVSTTNAPAARANHTAVWTGSQMLIWGGNNNYSNLNTGARYYPAINTWTNITTAGAPTNRTLHTAVWSGSEMLVWGGNNGTNLNTGGRYNNTNDTWTSITTTGAPGPRESHTAVWNGSEMMVWGGDNGLTNLLNTGARYNPTSNTWTTNTLANAPSARTQHAAVWDGTEMIVWGGTDGTNNLITGGRYNPTNNTWTTMETSAAPNDPPVATAVWDGSEMITLSGLGGGRYDPVSDSWNVVGSIPDNFEFRTGHSAVWDGSKMILFGGTDGVGYFDDIFSYIPPQALYIYQKP